MYNLRFTDDIDFMGDSENELQDLTTRLEEKTRAYVIEVNPEKSTSTCQKYLTTTPTRTARTTGRADTSASNSGLISTEHSQYPASCVDAKVGL